MPQASPAKRPHSQAALQHCHEGGARLQRLRLAVVAKRPWCDRRAALQRAAAVAPSGEGWRPDGRQRRRHGRRRARRRVIRSRLRRTCEHTGKQRRRHGGVVRGAGRTRSAPPA
jgi:hypothetical protein